MKNRLAVLSTLLGMTAAAFLMDVAKANAASCTARCPATWTQTSYDCTPSTGTVCVSTRCAGTISCLPPSGSTTVKIPCGCQ
jgi:hypothetical protein